jgi:hypothetical protein
VARSSATPSYPSRPDRGVATRRVHRLPALVEVQPVELVQASASSSGAVAIHPPFNSGGIKNRRQDAAPAAAMAARTPISFGLSPGDAALQPPACKLEPTEYFCQAHQMITPPLSCRRRRSRIFAFWSGVSPRRKRRLISLAARAGGPWKGKGDDP